MALEEYYDLEGAKLYDIQSVGLSCFQKCLFPSLRASWKLTPNPTMKIADLACGTGNFTRPLKRLSGGTVIGVDLSGAMIEYARKKEEENPLGITYIKADCSKDLLQVPEIAALAPFDMINVAWLVEYAKDITQLRQMIKNMYNLLKPGGVVYSLAENTDMALADIVALQRYGMLFPGITDPAKEEVYDYKEKKDAAYSVAIYIENPKLPPCVLGYYSWTMETVEQIIREVGFSKYERQKKLICVSENEYEAEFYRTYTECPDMILTQATK